MRAGHHGFLRCGHHGKFCPLIKEICRLYGVKPGSKWASITLVGTICVGCSFYMLLPFKSLPAVVFSSYTQMSGGDSIALVPYLAIVVVITAITMALLLVLMKIWSSGATSA